MVGELGSNLSGGQRQRIGLARALASDPDFIVCDEPVSALDVSVQAQIIKVLKKLCTNHGAAVMLITHALDEANLLSDRIGVMSARPGRFIEIVETGWDRARDSSLAERPEFGAVTSRLWTRLRGESLRALGQGAQAEAAR